ncbi:MAG: hypothetical protein ACP5LS_01765 [Thermoprotei archaeon]
MSESWMPIIDIRRGLNHVDVLVRVIDVGEKRNVVRFGSPMSVSEAVVGDESGRIKLVLWGDKAGTVKRGQAIMVRNAFVTEWHGQLELNAADYTSIVDASNLSVPDEKEIPRGQPRQAHFYRRGSRRVNHEGRRSWR